MKYKLLLFLTIILTNYEGEAQTRAKGVSTFFLRFVIPAFCSKNIA